MRAERAGSFDTEKNTYDASWLAISSNRVG